jgi:hypothetical protein
MNTPAALALVHALLIPNLRGALPFVIILLMIQGIHPEIIFELISHVQISHRQYHAIIMAWTQLRLFASLLPAVKGVKPQTFQGQRSRFRKFPQDPVSRVFARFQNEVILKRLERLGFAGTLPSLEVVQGLVSDLAIVRMSPMQISPIGQLFLAPNANLVLLKMALRMKMIIERTRSSYPEIVFLLSHNKNALMNLIMVWSNQMIVKQTVYGSLFDILEPAKMHTLFIFCILAVIDPDFIDEILVQFIQNYGDPNMPIPYFSKHLDFLAQTCESFEPINLQVGDIRRIIELFSSMLTSTTRVFDVRYALKRWSMAFGQIVYSGQPQFEEITFEQGSSMPIFDVFTRFWDVFFRNFARTFAVSFLPFGNIPWSEGYTRLCTTEFDWIIRIVVGNFAFRIGALDDHAFLRGKTPRYMHTEITSTSYGILIFPDGIRNSRMSSEICSCFLRDFWLAHRKPDPNMSDIDYIRWLFSIPGTFAIFGKSWIELVDALQNGTELSGVRDGSSGDFSYLSCPTVETDPEVQQSYDDNFRRQLGRDPEISDYFEGGTAVPPLPSHAGGSALPP